MATDDQQILVTGQQAAPTSFKISGTGEIRPKVMNVVYDGTGAGSTFLPALEIISDGGVVVARAVASSIAAGGSAEVCWFPAVSDILSLLPLPGQIIQLYNGLSSAVDFTFSSAVFVVSNFPANPTFTKISGTSALRVSMLADFTAPVAVPDVIFCGVFVDGVNVATTGIHISSSGNFATAGNCTVISAGRPLDPVLPAGAHTITLRVATISGNPTTLRSSTSVTVSIEEFEP